MTFKLLLSGRKVPETLCLKVKEPVESKIPNLVPSVRYTLREICSDVFWNRFDKGDQIAAGHYVADAVKRNEIPLFLGEKTSSNSRTFYK